MDTETCIIFLITDLDVNAIGTSLENLRFGEFNFSFDILVYLTYLFAL